MGLNILNPRDAYVARNTNISWSGIGGQVSYELMYKLKNSKTWNTLGVVNSEKESASLSGIFDRVESYGYSFTEIQYRVKVRTNMTFGDETETGIWYSDAYNLIFKPEEKATLKAKNGSDTILIPLFEQNAVSMPGKINARTDERTVLEAPLVEPDHSLKSGLKVNVQGRVFDVAKEKPDFEATGVYANAYITVAGSYYGYRMGTEYSTGYYYRNHTSGPGFYQTYRQYYYISSYYYVYNGTLYYSSAQYSYSQTGTYSYTVGYKQNVGYYTYYRTGTYYYSGFSAGWVPVFTYGSYLLGSGYYYYSVKTNESYTYSYNYYYQAGESYRYSYYLAG